MTLNRYLILIALLISSTLAFLSYAPAQYGRWLYIWQATIYPGKAPKKPYRYTGVWWHEYKDGQFHAATSFNEGFKEGPSYSLGTRYGKTYWIREDYHLGLVKRFEYLYDSIDRIKLVKIMESAKNIRRETMSNFLNDPLIIAYSPADGIDRRKEFGLNVE